MRKSAALKHFKTEAAIARALNISRTAVHKWGPVVPVNSAYRLQAITGGDLPVIPSLYSPDKIAGYVAAASPG